MACGALGKLLAKRNPACIGAECGERWTAKRAVLPKCPVVMLRIVVIDKDRLCAQGKAGVPRLSADRINCRGWGFSIIWQVALKGAVRRSSFVSKYDRRR